MSKKPAIRLASPQLQINFSRALVEIRKLYLQEALSKTVGRLKTEDIDRELAALVPDRSLSALAAHGLRGELVFAVPCVLKRNPRLLGYYRLLLGFSQKAFYVRGTGLSSFMSMEEKGVVSSSGTERLPALCEGLIECACRLLDGMSAVHVSRALLDDLTLLTLGAQLRGGANVRIGSTGIAEVFEVIHRIVKKSVVASGADHMEIRNAAGRKVLIEFAPDPDIIIREEMSSGSFRNVIAVEVKAGTDFSNIHNRIGEAEKTHQKARQTGFVECWTVVNVDRIDMKMATKESPSTNRFYRLSSLVKGAGKEFDDFRERVVSLAGVRAG